MSPDDIPTPHYAPAIVLLAVAEVQRRHQAEMQEVLLAARAVSDLPEGVYTLDLAKGEWVPRVSDG